MARILLTAVLLAGFASSRSIAQNPPASTACSAPASQALIGLWEPGDVSQPGLAYTIEFRPDGTFVEATTVIINSTYRISGDQLLVDTFPGDPTGGKFKLKIEGDTLVQTIPSGESFTEMRFGPAKAGNSSIVGAWRSDGKTGAAGFENYTADGRKLVRLPMTGTTGCYQIAGNQLSLTRPNSKTVSSPFELKTGELVLTDPGNNRQAYRKSAEGPWYDREHFASP
jgi:hypothetical protein